MFCCQVKEPNILSISATHDASVAIYRGNQLVLNRAGRCQEKRQVDTQRISKYCLCWAGMNIDSIDEVILNRKIYEEVEINFSV